MIIVGTRDEMGTWQSHSQGHMVHAEGSPVLQAGTCEVGLAGTVVEVDLWTELVIIYLIF